MVRANVHPLVLCILANDTSYVPNGGILHQMLPLVIENIDRAFARRHPIGNCELVITYTQYANLICTDWVGTKMTGI